MADVTVWFNPRCGKCRGAEELLADRGVDVRFVHHLDCRRRAEIERPVVIRADRAVGARPPRAAPRSARLRARPDARGLD